MNLAIPPAFFAVLRVTLVEVSTAGATVSSFPASSSSSNRRTSAAISNEVLPEVVEPVSRGAWP